MATPEIKEPITIWFLNQKAYDGTNIKIDLTIEKSRFPYFANLVDYNVKEIQFDEPGITFDAVRFLNTFDQVIPQKDIKDFGKSVKQGTYIMPKNMCLDFNQCNRFYSIL